MGSKYVDQRRGQNQHRAHRLRRSVMLVGDKRGNRDADYHFEQHQETDTTWTQFVGRPQNGEICRQ